MPAARSPQQDRQDHLGLYLLFAGMLVGVSPVMYACFVSVSLSTLAGLVFYGVNGGLALIFGAGYLWVRSMGRSIRTSVVATSAFFAIAVAGDFIFAPDHLVKLVHIIFSLI